MGNQSEEKDAKRILIGILIVLVLFVVIFIGATGSRSTTPQGLTSQPSTPPAAPSSNSAAELNAKIGDDNTGVYITNMESGDWSDCEFGINGSWVALISSPPYSTQTLFTVKAGEQKFIPYSSITANDGTIFNPTTHTINSVELICFVNSGADMRFYQGTRTSN